MKINCLLNSVIILAILCACADQNGSKYAGAGEIEVRFNVLRNETGSPEYELKFIFKEKVIAKRVYKNGQAIVSEGLIPDGQAVERYENGSIKNIFNYKNGNREGKAFGYFQNGKIKIESMYKDDNPIGLSKTYYEDGQIMSESEIVDGKKTFYKEYYKTGELKEEVYYKNGEGISKTYDINGNPIKY
jgi:antitoxin component YwqK of YwqJK toxin-antitoxin module